MKIHPTSKVPSPSDVIIFNMWEHTASAAVCKPCIKRVFRSDKVVHDESLFSSWFSYKLVSKDLEEFRSSSLVEKGQSLLLSLWTLLRSLKVFHQLTVTGFGSIRLYVVFYHYINLGELVQAFGFPLCAFLDQ